MMALRCTSNSKEAKALELLVYNTSSLLRFQRAARPDANKLPAKSRFTILNNSNCTDTP